MAAGQASRMRFADPRKVRILDRHGKARCHEIWVGNPNIARFGEAGEFQTLINGPGERPYIAAKTPQQWTWREWDCQPGEIYFTKDEIAFGRKHAGRIVIEPHIKPKASPNKLWSWVSWGKLAYSLNNQNERPVQLGRPDTHEVIGADLIVTPTFRHAAAVIAFARGCVLLEGGLHHAAAAVGTSAVVLYGGFIGPQHTGYDRHTNLFTGGHACGMRVPCAHCKDAMAAIRPADVLCQLEKAIERNNGRDPAAMLARYLVAGA